MQTKKVIAIIGGGAAGMMTAASILEHIDNARDQVELHIFEKNSKLGEKVLISGGGRCNVTTGVGDKKTLLSKYARGSEFLGSYAFKVFSPKKCYDRFNQHTPLKVEDDLRVFPVSDNGGDVVGIFEEMFFNEKINIHFSEPVEQINLRHGVIVCEDGCPREKNFLLVTPKAMYQADYVVLTTGGNAYGHTGSTGDGYDFATKCGHEISRLGPSLNSFLTEEMRPHHLPGISLPNAQLVVTGDDDKVYKEIGPLLFTHFGVSGPVTFALSGHLAYTKISKKSPARVAIIPDASKSYEDWQAILKEEFDASAKREVKNIIGKFFPKRFVEALLTVAGIKPYTQTAHITKDDRKKLAHLLSGKLEVSLIGRRPGDEFVTAGGVALEGVNPSTMESQHCTGLYFAGEILNIDGVTGGYNLQSSWATGYVAGKSIAQNVVVSS